MTKNRPPTTAEQAEDVEKYLTYARHNGEALGVISSTYLNKLDSVLKHLRVRLARGEWKPKSAGQPKTPIEEPLPPHAVRGEHGIAYDYGAAVKSADQAAREAHDSKKS